MRVLEINSVQYGSTGKIMLQIASEINSSDGEGWIAVPKGRHNKEKVYDKTVFIGNRLSEDSHLILSRLTGFNGCFSWIATKRFIQKIKQLEPDVIHLHNLHNSYINLPLLFAFLKEYGVPVVWTLHDCWSFTGQCPHFTIAKCDRWKTGCQKCPQYRQYPQSYVDRTKTMWKLKRKWFSGVPNMTIVTPSNWLAALAKQSFLKDYPVKVINNGIDLSVFKPTPSDFRKKNGIPDDCCMVLGVAFGWGVRKGLDVFIELAKRLDPNKYRIVLVGTDAKVDSLIPSNIVSIHRTMNQTELAEIYTAADLFVNPTREENYPTVNMESIACGTPVVTFNTGGSPEALAKETGAVVPCDNYMCLENTIVNMKDAKKSIHKDCIEHAKSFDQHLAYKKYYGLYLKLLVRNKAI